MSTTALNDTTAALGGERLPLLKSRSLFQSKFSDPQANDNTSPTRKEWILELTKKSSVSRSLMDQWYPSKTTFIYARLQSRLIVNISAGVMENAHIHLNQYGIPTIPGSAVKGCARRMAIQALHDWVLHSTETDSPIPAPDDLCAPCCQPFENPAEMLANIAHIFGWIESDWTTEKKDNRWKSDFCWAVNGNLKTLNDAKNQLPEYEAYAGTVSFLEAYPNTDPGIEIDILTPHHTKYYQGDPHFIHAPDTEDPVPNFFPAVKAQRTPSFFQFPILPLNRVKQNSMEHAKLWLSLGLEILGLGAKTAAGYGWFDSSETIQIEALEHQKKTKENHRNEQLKKQQLLTKQQEKERLFAIKQQQQQATQNFSPEQKEDWKIDQLNSDQLQHKLKSFFKEAKKGGPSAEEKAAIVRALKDPERLLTVWKSFKLKAQKGPLAQAAQAIHTLNKQLHGDKMP